MKGAIPRYDVVIIGSSYTGLSLALLLAKAGLNIGIVTAESQLITKEVSNSTKKLAKVKPSKLFALNTLSSLLLEQILGKESKHELENFSQPINQIRVVDYNSHSKVDFWPHEIDLEDFGFLIDEAILRNILIQEVQKLEACKRITMYLNSTIAKQENLNNSIKVNLSDNQQIVAMLLVGADGRYSKVREIFGIEVIRKYHNQTAIVCDIHHPTWNHLGIAVEKFRPSGPFAILPKVGDYYSSLVWTEKTESAKVLASLAEKEIQRLLTDILDGYLNETKITSAISLYPLSSIIAKQLVQKRMALIGDAAHGMHPVAGQGLNLGLRDVSCLAGLILDQHELGMDLGSSRLLKQYEEQRRNDVYLMIGTTNSLVWLFSNNSLFLKMIRRFGMKIMDSLPLLKKLFTSYACGKTIV